MTSTTSQPTLNFSILKPHQAIIDLTTKEGQTLFRKASREDIEDGDRVSCTLATSTKVVEHFLDQARKYNFTPCIDYVPIQWHLDTTTSTPYVAPLVRGSILKSKTVGRANVLLQARLVFTRNVG